MVIARLYGGQPQAAIQVVLATTTVSILTAPLMIALALIVKLESRGPALFVQVRVGKDGKVFNLLKFRTMHVNTDVSAHRAQMEALMKSVLTALTRPRMASGVANCTSAARM